jgi:hypothetical protein
MPGMREPCRDVAADCTGAEHAHSHFRPSVIRRESVDDPDDAIGQHFEMRLDPRQLRGRNGHFAYATLAFRGEPTWLRAGTK